MRVEKVFSYVRDRMALDFETFAKQNPGPFLYYTLAIPKPGQRPRTTTKVESSPIEVLPPALRALRSEAYRSRIVRLDASMAPLIIGRDDPAELTLPFDENASSRHAEITWVGDRPVIRDLGSKNGTSVNGTILVEPRGLQERDLVLIGATVLHVFGARELYDVLSALLDPHSTLPS